MRLTFLGTGTSHGIPRIGCDCAVCRSTNSRNKRFRPSVYIEQGDRSVLIDTTPDFRTQALRAGIRRVDAVLITHTHSDHVLGLDDLRVFTTDGHKLPVCGSPQALADIERVFPYACTPTPKWPGLPSFDLCPLEPYREFEVAGLRCRSLPVMHGRMSVYAYRLGDDLAYVTDCNVVPDETVAACQGVTVLVLDALRHAPHITHLNIEQAIAIARRIGAKLTLFTHMNHEVEHEAVNASLPAGIQLAYDELQVSISDGRWELGNAV